MAVTLTDLDLAVALRISDGSAALESPVDAEVARLLASTSRLVTDYAPDAPDAIQNEAVIRVAGWLWDVPRAGPHGWQPARQLRCAGHAGALPGPAGKVSE